MQRNKRRAAEKVMFLLLTIFTSIFISILVITIEFHPIVITSGSMEPALNIGDVVFIQREINYENIYAGPDGDILVIANSSVFLLNGAPAFIYDSIDNNTPIIHRAIQKLEINGTYYFVTKGDNNQYPDGCVKYDGIPNQTFCIIEYNLSNPVLIPEKYVIGKVIFSIPYIGYFKIWLWQIIFHIGTLFGILSIIKLKKTRMRK